MKKFFLLFLLFPLLFSCGGKEKCIYEGRWRSFDYAGQEVRIMQYEDILFFSHETEGEMDLYGELNLVNDSTAILFINGNKNTLQFVKMEPWEVDKDYNLKMFALYLNYADLGIFIEDPIAKSEEEEEDAIKRATFIRIRNRK